MTKRISDRTSSTSPARMVTGRLSQGVLGRIGATLACLSLMTSLSAPLAQAQVIKDPRAPIAFRPKIGRSANGTPLVDIVKPSFGGISHNKFQRYDIDTRGVILNNSKLGGTSIIGGRVSANPNLVNSRPARVILNEVTSTARSTLNGPTEVFGSRADVIVANPNGVGCVGCTFINSGRVTLSTGTPIPDYRRGTVDFDVTRGRITISGAGLSSGGKKPLDAIDLVGRRIAVDGPVEAKDSVRLRAGGMRYDQAGDVITPKLAAELPAVTGPAIRSGSAGTIRAGTLSVVSRDVDLGIALDGQLESLSGEIAIRSFGDAKIASSFSKSDLSLTAEGQILLTGQNHALGRISAYGKHIEIGLEGDVLANDAVVMEALQSLTSRGILQAGNTVSLVSGGDLVAEGTIAANNEVLLEGRTVSSTGLQISGGNVSVAGLDNAELNGTTVVATKDSIKVAGQDIVLGEGTLFQAENQLVIDAKNQLTNGTILDNGNLNLSVRNSFTNAATGQIIQDRVLLILRDGFENAGTIYGRQSTTISGNTLSNAETGVIFGGEVSVTLENGLTNLGQVLSDRTLGLVAGDVVNKGVIQAGTELKLKATSYRADSAAAALAGAAAELIVAGAFENSGLVLGTDTLSISGAGSVTNEGFIQSEGALRIDGLDYHAGASAVLSGKTVEFLNGGDFENKGQVTGSEKLIVNAATLSNLGSSASMTGGHVSLSASGDVTNEGTFGGILGLGLVAAGNLTTPGMILVSGTDAAAAASLDTTADLALTVSGKIVSGADLIAQGDVLISASAFETTAASARLGGASITIDVSGGFTSLGQIGAQDNLTIRAGSILIGPSDASATAGTVTGHVIALQARNGDVRNLGIISASAVTDAANVKSLGSLSIAAVGYDVVNDGTIAADMNLDLAAANYDAGALAQLGAETLVARLSGSFDNLGFVSGTKLVDIEAARLTNGPIDAADPASKAGMILGERIVLGKPSVPLGDLSNQGLIQATRNLTIDAGTLANSGSLIAYSDVPVPESDPVTITLRVAGVVQNDGEIQSGDKLSLTSSAYSASTTTALLKAKTLTLGTGTLDNAGAIYGATSLTLVSNALTNRGSAASIGGAKAEITTYGDLSNSGLIAADDELTATAHGAVTNSGSMVTGLGNLTLTADGFVSSSGVLAATGQLSITAASLSNSSAAAQMGGASMVVHVDAGDFSNLGFVNGGTSLEVTSARFSNGPDGSNNAGLITADTVLVTAASDVTNLGTLQSGASLTVSGQAGLTNAGKIVSDGSLLIDVVRIIDNQSEIAAADLTLKGAGYAGSGTSALNGSDITAHLSGAFANSGKIDARGMLTVTAQDVSNATGGQITAGGIDLTAQGGLNNAGIVKSEVFGTLVIQGNLINSGRIESLGDLGITSAGALDNSNLIQAGNVLAISAGPIENRSGARLQSKALSLTSTGAVTNGGIIDGSEQVFITAASLTNHGVSASNYASITSKTLSVDVSGALTLGTNSLLQGTNDAIIKAQTVASDFFRKDTIANGRFSFGNNLDFTLTQGGWTFNQDLKVKGNLSFKVAGNIVNRATIAAGGTLALISTGGSITNGVNNTANPGGGLIYSNGDMTLTAHDDLRNYASVIQSGGNLLIDVDGEFVNTRTDIVTTADGSAPTGYPYDWKYTSYFFKDSETSGPSIVQAQGAVTIDAHHVLNVASTVAAGTNLTITAFKVEHLARTLYRTEYVIKTGGTTNIGKIFETRQVAISETPALFYAAGQYLVNHSGPYIHTGTVQAQTAVILGPSTTVGVSNPNLPTAPSRIPDPVIDLADGEATLFTGLVPGSGPAYAPDPNAKAGVVASTSADQLSAAVDADGQPVTRPGDTEVKVNGTVRFLHATPVPSGQTERNPSWIFAELGANAASLTFFADPSTERRLIQQALLEQTGRAILDPKYKNPQDQQEKLYEGTVDFLRANPEIKIGSKLTAAQRAKVTGPILWYEYQTINGKKVLVPQLILPEKDLKKYASITGGSILAEDVYIQGDKVTNTGTILAVNSLSIDAKQFLNERRVASTGTYTSAIQAGGVLSAKTISIETKRDIVNRGGMMLAGDSLVLKAGGNIRLETQVVVNAAYAGNKKNWTSVTTVENIGGIVSSGGTLSMEARKTIHIVGSTVTSVGDMALVGLKGVTIEAAFDRVDLAAGGQSSGFLTKKSFAANASTATTVSSLVSSSGGSVGIRTERGDIAILGSNVSARDNITLLAGYDADGKAIKGSKASVVVSSVQATTDLSYQQKKSGFGLFFGDGGFDLYRKTSVAGTTSMGTNVASSLSTRHGDITVKATWDVTVRGSTVTAKEGAIAMRAARDLKILPGADTASDAYEKKTSGIGIHVSGGKDGFSVAAGYSSATLRQGAAASVVAKSYLSAGQGITLRAGRDVTVVAAVIGAKGKVDIHGNRDTNILAGENRTYAYQSAKETFKGIRAEVRQNVTSALRQIRQVPGLAGSGYGNAAYQAVAGLSAAMSLTDNLLSLSNPTLSASLTVGASGKYSTAQAWSVTAVPTTIKAGELRVTAGRDLHMVGTQAKVTGDLWLDAGRNILIESAQSTARTAAHQSSWNAGIGWGGSCSAVNGCSGGLYAEGSYAQARNGTTSLTNENASFDVGGHAHVGSGRNTTFRGVVLTAATADLDVKGNFTLESVQDLSHGSGSSASFSGSGTVGTTGFNGSVSFGGSTSSSDRAWVTEQSGIYTRDGNLNATVGHNTTLIGSVMEAQGGKVNLDTRTLTMRDLQDHDVGTSYGGQVGLGYGEQQTGLGQQGQGSGTLSGQVASYAIEQTTKAAIGEGTLTVRDEKHSQTTAAEANRDTANTQVITKDERSGLQFYGSTTAIQEIASGFAGIQDNVAKLPQAASAFVDKLVDLGKLTKDSAAKVKDVLGALKDMDPASFAVCGGGRQGFNLFDLIVTTAYAADGGCLIRFAGQKDGLNLSPEEYDALRQSVVTSAEKEIKAELPRYQQLLGLQASGTLTAAQAAELGSLQGRLQEQMAYFELCSDSPGGLRASGLIPAGLLTMVQAAEAYRKGGDAIASQVLATTSYSAAQLTNLRKSNPQLAMAAYYLLYDRNPQGVDAIFQLNGATKPGVSEQTRATLITTAAANFAQAAFKTDISAFQGTSTGLIAAMQTAAKELTLDQQILLAFEVNQYANAYANQVEGSVKKAQAATAVILGAAAAAAVAPAAVACLQNLVCVNEAGIAIAEAAGGEALGGGAVAVGGAAAVVKTLEANAVKLGLSNPQSIAAGAALRVQLMAEEIASGHGFQKHIQEFANLGITTQKQYNDFVAKLIRDSTSTRYASDGRIFFLDEKTKTVVVYNPFAEGTAFRPGNWNDYKQRYVPKRTIPY